MTRMLVGALAIYLLGLSVDSAMGQALPRVILQTELGDIEVEVDTVRAPATGANFLRYVDLGFYRAGHFHRTVRSDNQPDNAVKIGVIQGGIDSVRKDWFPPIELERTSVTKLRHLDGTISMARGNPNSARSSFFICIGDQPELDYGGKRNSDGQGFAAFGRVECCGGAIARFLMPRRRTRSSRP
jgi:peptidyl-prolyl cis-trans isomerase A (cyclophilin A)